MNLPDSIPKGQHGWRIRRAERAILERMEIATVAQCGHRMWQKLHRQERAMSGEDLCRIMAKLCREGWLQYAGEDDGDAVFLLPGRATDRKIDKRMQRIRGLDQ